MIIFASFLWCTECSFTVIKKCKVCFQEFLWDLAHICKGMRGDSKLRKIESETFKSVLERVQQRKWCPECSSTAVIMVRYVPGSPWSALSYGHSGVRGDSNLKKIESKAFDRYLL